MSQTTTEGNAEASSKKSLPTSKKRKMGDKTPLLVNDEKDASEYEAGLRGYGSDQDPPTLPRPTTTSTNSATDSGTDISSKHAGHTPKESYNSILIYSLTFLSAIGGFLFGYDTGVVSGAMLLIKDKFNLTSFWQELVVSVTIAAAAIFALVGGFLNDRIGRKPTILIASVIFTVGAVILGISENVETLLVGRLTVGIGIGFASTTVPMYIAESAPVHLRGRLVTLNNLFITCGQFIASVVDGLFSYDKEDGWRYMLGLAGVPSLIQCVGFIFMPESPRWLASKGQEDKARAVLQRIHGTNDVEKKLELIQQGFKHTQQEMTEQGKGAPAAPSPEPAGSSPALIRLMKTSHVRKALVVGCGLQLFQQICGINTVMYYSASIIKMSGVTSASLAIWLAALTAFVNFAFTFVGLYLVERIGRRKLTLGSLMGTAASLAVLAVSFQLAAFNSPSITTNSTAITHNTTSCSMYSECDDCMRDAQCGFCYQKSALHTNNTCLPGGSNPSEGSAGGPCQTQADSAPWQWAYDYCPTAYSWMATLGLMLYLACFAPGMGPMPWTINSEIYPLWARSTGTALATSVNWIFNLLISLTFLTLTEVLTRYGAFWLYFSFAVAGCVFIYALLPETKGKSLEQMESLFKEPWSTCCSPATS